MLPKQTGKRRRSKECRAFISAILVQAFNDALGGSGIKIQDKMSALRFIDSENEMFCMYCSLLDLDPEYTAVVMKKQIKSGKFKPLKELRE